MNYFTVSLELVKTLADFKFSEHEIKRDEIGIQSEENAIKTKLFELGYKIYWKRHYLFNLIRADYNEDREQAKRELENYLQFEGINELIKDYRKTEKIYEYRFQ